MNVAVTSNNDEAQARATERREGLLKAGYWPIPLHGKRPVLDGWQDLDEDRTRKAAQDPTLGLNTGIRTGIASSGGEAVYAIDVDTPDPRTAMRVLEALRSHGLPDGALQRTGQAPKTLFLYRGAPGLRKRKTGVYEINGTRNAVERLGFGQQFAAFGVHPDTNKPFVWADDKAPGPACPDWNLPTLDEAAVEVLMNVCEDVLAQQGTRVERPTKGGAGGSRKAIGAEGQVDQAQVREVLRFIDCGKLSYDDWLKHLCAIKQALGVPGYLSDLVSEAQEVVLKWCESYAENTVEMVARKWESIDESEVGWSWLQEQARENGMSPGHGAKVDFDSFEVDGDLPDALVGEDFVSPREAREKRDAEEKKGRGAGPLPIVWADKVSGPELSGNWLVKGMVPAEGLCVMFGRPGCGKSFLAQDLGMCVAAGQDWQGYRLKKPGLVLYVASEGGRAQAVNRMWGWRQKWGVGAPWFVASPATLDLRSSDEDGDRLIAAARAASFEAGLFSPTPVPVSLVVIDTLNRNMGSGDENSAVDMSSFVEQVERVRRALGCAVLVVHHSGKDEARGSRGHSSLLGALDAELEISRDQGFPGKVRLSKLRQGQDGIEWGFDLEVIKLGVDDDLDDVTTCVVVPAAVPRPKVKPSGKNQELVAQVFDDLQVNNQTNPFGKIDREDVIDDCITRLKRDGERADAQRRKDLKRAVDALVERQYFDEDSNGLSR